MLNLLCGPERRVEACRAAGHPGEWAAWSDPVCQGPAPAGLALDAWRRVRASFLARSYLIPFDAALRTLVAEDDLIAGLGEWDEIVVWAEPDVRSQTGLIQLLARVAQFEWRTVPIWLGAGQVERREVSAELLGFAVQAWTALTAPAPSALVEVAAEGHAELPSLGPALHRLLREYPAAEDGLSLTERRLLEELADAPLTARDLSDRVRAREEHPWLDDMMFDAVVLQLMGGSRPLVSAGGWPEIANFPDAMLVATAAGRDVLAGRADQVRLNGVDRWIGGVHLAGLDAFWRWDRAADRLVSGSDRTG